MTLSKETAEYLGVAIARNGRIFAHPANGTPDADLAAHARGDYPYQHLYAGDDVEAVLDGLQDTYGTNDQPQGRGTTGDEQN